MRRKIFTALALGAVLLSAGASALAQTPMPDPLDTRSAKRLDDMEQVMRELRAIVYQGRATGKPVVIEDSDNGRKIDAVSQRIDILTQRIADLTATLTQQNADRDRLTQQLQQTQRDLTAASAANRTLADRIGSLEKRNADTDAAARAAAQAAAAQAAAEAALTPDVLFARGRQSFADNDLASAEKDFQSLVDRFPGDAHGPESNYWLGEIQTKRADFSDAMVNYVAALAGWPQTPWAPTATLNLARNLVAAGNNAQACEALTSLSSKYPRAPAPIPASAVTLRTQAKCPR
ncbi:MAG: ygbF [Caulobacteraceae bacterium]|nr:ygbF [Caulobacteraceae bacterium]